MTLLKTLQFLWIEKEKRKGALWNDGALHSSSAYFEKIGTTFTFSNLPYLTLDKHQVVQFAATVSKCLFLSLLTASVFISSFMVWGIIFKFEFFIFIFTIEI